MLVGGLGWVGDGLSAMLCDAICKEGAWRSR